MVYFLPFQLASKDNLCSTAGAAEDASISSSANRFLEAELKNRIRTTQRLVRRAGIIELLSLALLVFSSSLGAAEQSKPQYGGTIIVGTESEPTTLNPYINNGSETITLGNHVYEKLVECDLAFNVIPAFAESWQVSGDGLTYTFKVAKGEKWSDGVSATSKDIAWSFMEAARIYHPRLSAVLSSTLEAVDTPDDQTAVLRLKTPFAPLLNILASGGAPVILPQHLYQGQDFKTNPANLKPVGTGPYTLDNWVKGSYISLVKNPNYHVKGAEPFLDKVIFQFLPDVNSRWLALESGEVDFLNYYMVPLEQVERGSKNPNLVLDERGGEGVGALSGLIVNTRKGPIAKREVRQALAYAIDRDAIIKRAFLGRGKVGRSVMHSGLVRYFDNKVPAYPYDPAKANALLDDAGLPRGADGTRFTLRLTWATGRDVETSVAQMLQDQLGKVGINLALQRYDRAAAIKSIYIDWDFDMALWVLATGPEPTMQITRSYDSKNIKPAPFTNASGYSNPVTDELFDGEVAITDPDKRVAAWNRLQEILMTDLPFIPLVEVPVTNFYSAKFADVITKPYANAPDVTQAWQKTK
jgi:peptide/nickel transport system substrate-binding protein